MRGSFPRGNPSILRGSELFEPLFPPPPPNSTRGLIPAVGVLREARALYLHNAEALAVPAETSQPARPSGDETAGMLPGEPGAQVGSASKASRVLDPEEIKLFVKQGEQFIAAGDVVTARIVFQRAAEAGDAGAAVTLGGHTTPSCFQNRVWRD
jgi:hypothetical protein